MKLSPESLKSLLSLSPRCLKIISIALAFLGCILFWILYGIFHRGQPVGIKENKNNVVHERTFTPPAGIENFDPVQGGALVLTANLAEFNAVIKTLRERNSLRKVEARMTFSIMEKGISKVIWRVRRGTVMAPVEVYVVNAAEISSTALVQKLGEKKFHLLSLRGHTGDMKNLWDYSTAMQDKYCFIILGGCTASVMIRDMYSPQKPVMADVATGQSANNTYLLVRVVDLVGGHKVTSWEALASSLAADSVRASQQTVMPGKYGYDRFASK